MHVRPVEQVADADRGADPVISEALEMVDEVLVKVSFDIVPSDTFWNPKWPCRSVMVGITVLPVRSTCVAPAGTCSSPRRPTRVNRPFSTVKAELSIGALPSPVIRRAPSYTVTAAVWLFTAEGPPAAQTRHANSSGYRTLLPVRMEASLDVTRFVSPTGVAHSGRPRGPPLTQSMLL
jgi:hypothetical protein